MKRASRKKSLPAATDSAKSADSAQSPCSAAINAKGTSPDVTLVLPYIYSDHPSFPEALIARVFSAAGYTLAIIEQPRWQENRAFAALPRPKLFFAIIPGPVDSVVLNYTSTHKRRNEDLYQFDGNAFFDGPESISSKIRPDRVLTVFAARLRESFRDVPIIIGGLEGSLRRFAHWDFQQEKIRRPILLDTRADLLVVGMGEKQILRIAEALARGESANTLALPGTARVAPAPPPNAVLLPRAEDVIANPSLLLPQWGFEQEALRTRRPAAQECGKRFIVYEGAENYSANEIDALYELPFTRSHTSLRAQSAAPIRSSDVCHAQTAAPIRPLRASPASPRAQAASPINSPRVSTAQTANPSRAQAVSPINSSRVSTVQTASPSQHTHAATPIRPSRVSTAQAANPSRAQTAARMTPALRMNLFSITTHRGCAGGCAFCSICAHSGGGIVSRSIDSIMREIRSMERHPAWRGVVTDLGAASADMYGADCPRSQTCARASCLSPDCCPEYAAREGRVWRELLRAARSLHGTRKVMLASGVRYETLLANPELLEEILRSHTGAFLRVAPEHTEDHVLALMRKSPFAFFARFVTLFRETAARLHSSVDLECYIMVGHPGERACDVTAMREKLCALGLLRHLDVQIFTPTPGTLSTALFCAGTDAAGAPIPVERSIRELIRRQRSLIDAE
ncbi:MAG: radical SAM protein [Spirochaetota bacterium]|nr:radical SAM protein [Spirochaetota bacterium]